MIVLPAIDLKGGKCVRLRQGRADDETVYHDDPVEVARNFEYAGAKMLHLVDLDGAFGEASANREVVRAIRAAISLPLELGGGIRAAEEIGEVLESGIDEVIVGTMAVREPEDLEMALGRHGGGRIQLGVDARDGKVAVHGRLEATEWDAIEFANLWKSKGIERVVFTDIARDGMLTGPNLDAIRRFAEGTHLRITASGGVSAPSDLALLAAMEPLGVDRAIVGKAIYEGRVSPGEMAVC